MTRIFLRLAVVAILSVSAASPAMAGATHAEVPDTVDANAHHYLIYLHGARPESFRLSEPHPTRGLSEYEKISGVFAANGFEVISELRTEKTNPRRYARNRSGRSSSPRRPSSPN